jgi:arylsulfatase A-like enzyme/Tfp pilus assembly protein PilF
MSLLSKSRAALFTTLVVSAACASAAAQVTHRTNQRGPTSRPVNVLLVTMDTLRADHVGCYGYPLIKTPTLDALARDGVRYDRAIAQVPLTWPSHAAILTGTYPFQNGVQDFTGQPLSPQFRTLAQAFKQRGYATGAVVSSFVLDRSWGLARGFDFYDDAFAGSAFLHKDVGLVDRKAAESVDQALSWLKKNRQRPFFLWLHLYDPHSPYDPPEPYKTEYKGRPYDGEIAYADAQLGRLITWLKENALYDRALIVFLSDHGESLGDHGEKEHGFFVYDSTVRVPLIVKPPGAHQAAVTASPVETIAVAPTILELAGIHDSIQKQFQANALAMQRVQAPENKKAENAYSETFYPFSSFGWSPLHSLQSGRYQYVEAPTPELYDVIADPEEKHNIAGQQSAVVDVFKEKLKQRLSHDPFVKNAKAGPGLSADAAERLRALGYVAYRSPVPESALAAGLPDPKDKLWEFNSILQASDAFEAENFAAGKSLLSAVREKDPKLYLVPFMLGESALRQQDFPTAVSEFQKCLELNPNFDQAMTGLARGLHEQGQSSEAKKWVQKALTYNPQNYRAWYELGWIESHSEPAAAVGAYERSISIQPNFALSRRDLGMLQLEQKNYAAAAMQLQKAVELGIADAKTLNFLGIAYSRTNRVKDAVATYQRALKADPQLAEAHLNLAYAYQRLNQPKAAQVEYEAACKLQQSFCQYVPQRP